MSAFVWRRAHTVAAVVTALVLAGAGVGLAVTRGGAEPAPAADPSTPVGSPSRPDADAVGDHRARAGAQARRTRSPAAR